MFVSCDLFKWGYLWFGLSSSMVGHACLVYRAWIAKQNGLQVMSLYLGHPSVFRHRVSTMVE